MMIRAYQEFYLDDFQRKMGNMFDYAINDCKMEPIVFIKYFLYSSISKGIEFGDITVITGRSGIELARDVIYEVTKNEIEVPPSESFTRSRAYWIGWAVCYYQWYSTRRFREIFEALPYEDLEKMYYPLHTADITKVIEVFDARLRKYFKDPNLKRYRKLLGMTQKELAVKAGVSLRSIQMYEQRQKDINKASVETVSALAKILHCPIEWLIEK